MKCDCGEELIPVDVSFICEECHYTLHQCDFSNLSVDELKQVIEECNYWITNKQKN